MDGPKSCAGLPGCREAFQEPGTIDKIKSFGKEVVKHYGSGAKKHNDEDYNKRISVCSTCEFLDKSRFTCKACGCYLKIKARWKSTSCPKNKWSI